MIASEYLVGQVFGALVFDRLSDQPAAAAVT
jgi:hypothetical protein